MKPLNFYNYLFLSIKSVSPQIILLMIKIALFIFLCSIGFAVRYGLQKDSIELINHYASISVKPTVEESRKQEILAEIRNIEGIEYEFYGTGNGDGLCKMIIFNTVCWTFQIDKTDVNYVLNSIKGEMIEGSLPNHPGEMIITQQLSKSLNKKVGDQIGSNERLPKTYVISGIYKGEHNVFIGYSNNRDDLSSFIYKINPNQAIDFHDKLLKYKDEVIIHIDRHEIENMIQTIFSLLKIVGIIILIISAFEVTISVSNLNRVYFSERAREFALLRAIGYSETFILKMLIRELSLIVILGLMGGMILGQTTNILFYHLYCFEKGIPYNIFELGLFMISSILTMIIFILSYLPIKKYIMKMDFIETIQETNI